MKNAALKKMLLIAKQELASATQKCAEIEAKLNKTTDTDFFVLFKKGTWGVTQDEAIISSKSVDKAIDALDASNHIYKNDALTEMLKNESINIGDVIAFPYSDDNEIETLLPFNVCEIEAGGEAIIHCRVALERVVFSKDDYNNYKNSDIRKHMAGLTNRFDPSLWNHFKVKDVRYIDSEKQCFGHVSDKFWLLDIDELFTWYKTIDERKRKCLGNDMLLYWWLRDPITGYVSDEYFVTTSGTITSYHAGNAYGCVPACLIG